MPKETRLVAQRVCRKDKLTDDRELWPHAISRHQSGDSTILRLRNAWLRVTSTSCRSRRCSLSLYTVDRIERTLQTKNTNAWKLLWRSQNEHSLRKCFVLSFVCQGEVLEKENTSHTITTHCDTCRHTHTHTLCPACSFYMFTRPVAASFISLIPLFKHYDTWRATDQYQSPASGDDCITALLETTGAAKERERERWREREEKENGGAKEQRRINLSACDRRVRAWRRSLLGVLAQERCVHCSAGYLQKKNSSKMQKINVWNRLMVC